MVGFQFFWRFVTIAIGQFKPSNRKIILHFCGYLGPLCPNRRYLSGRDRHWEARGIALHPADWTDLIMIKASSKGMIKCLLGENTLNQRRKPYEILHQPAQILLWNRSAHPIHVRVHPGSRGQHHVHQNFKTDPESFLQIIAPYREDVVVAVECMFTWYWLADLCAQQGIPFVLGHALYMKAIHGGKAKNDKIDSHKIAVLLRGGMIPVAYVYPPQMRSTRDLLRRRSYLMRKRAEAARPRPTHQQSIQPARDRQKDRLQSQPLRSGRTLP